MYAFRFDESAGLLVGAYSGAIDTDDDYERCIQSIISADQSTAKRRIPFACVLVVAKESPQPPPMWRKRMGEANGNLRSTPSFFALVAPNALIRGVFTAIRWLSKSRDGERVAALPTLAEAASWLRRQSGLPYPGLEKSYEQALREASSHENASLP